MRNKTIHFLILLLLLIATNVKTQSLFASERQDFQFIDLGLSVDWAICNLGAVTPEGFGNYFAFGELLPKQQFTNDNYKHSKIVLGDIQGNPLYDVAASSGIFFGCRIPTSEEWEELINNCVWSETIENGIKGQRITGPNGNSIFIPLSGWYDSRPQINDVGNYGRYWTSESTDDMANFVYIGSWERGISENPRYMGYSIRIVRGKVIIDELPDSCPHPDLPIDSVMPKKKKELPDSYHHPSFEFEAATPESGSVLNRLYEIVVDFATESVLTGSAEVDVVGAGVKATFAPIANAGQVKAALSQAVTAEGDYSITIPEGVFTAADGTSNEAVTLNYTVESFRISSIVITPAALNLETGETAKVSAIVLPEAANEKKFEWSSSNKDIVEVDYDGNVTVNAIGEAEIIATATDGSGVTAQIPVTVVYTHATALAIDPASVSLEADQRQVLTVVLDEETNKADDVVWLSDNEAVAVVEITEGFVEVVAKSFGDANITAQIKNGEEVVLTNTIAVKVSETVAQTVTVEPAELILESGQKFTFTTTVNEEATNKAVVWSSSAPEIVAVDAATGEVTALALTEEPVIITATAADGGGAFGTARVTVVQSPRKSDIHICPDENHPHAIDLGLPSGTKWSCCNIGAKHPEEPGDCFAWGEIESKDVFSDKNYSLKGKNIGNEISQTQCDAAYINWGNEWCTPTVKQFQELLEYCSTESIDCASGVIFTGPNGKKLFLPYFNDNKEDFGIGIYMSGSLSDYIDYLGPVNIEYTRSLFLFDLPNESYEMSREEIKQLSLLKTLAKVWDDTCGQKIIDWLKIAKQIIRPVKSNNN